MRPLLILFAKAPIPGRVKTRLIPPLTPRRAAQLHRAFVWDMLESLQLLSATADLELQTDSRTDAWTNSGVPRSLQHEGDLGLKMFQALHAALLQNRAQAVIVGSDAPTLPIEHLKFLLNAQADVALGPALDGGYYAIAARRVHPDMFEGVTWSSHDTLRQTQTALVRRGFTVELGRPWYDVDTAEDLERLRNERVLPRHTQKALQE